MNTENTFSELRPATWVVERLDIRGEEVPIIRHAKTWLPSPLAIRYSLRTRFKIGAASLTGDLRAVSILYNWAEAAEGIGNLEDFITSGKVLSRDLLLQFIPYLRRRHFQINDKITSASGVPINHLVSNQTFNSRLFAIQQFLEWAIEPTNHGGGALLDEDEREVQRTKFTRLLEDQKIPTGKSDRQEPLTVDEILLIRRAIAPDEFGDFPPNIFSEGTRYRNWTMFETALNFGTRKGEMLTLKVAHLPIDASDKRVFVPRQQDAEEDSRKRRRLRGKTNERLVPIMDPVILPSILRYRDAAPPVGRNDPRFTSPYLFLTETGSPVANSTADHIIKQTGEYAARLLEADVTLNEHVRAQRKESMLTLTWHRLRHTWAEQAALELYRKHGSGAWAILKERGGWNSEEALEHYISYAKRMINEQESREYQKTLTLGRHDQ